MKIHIWNKEENGSLCGIPRHMFKVMMGRDDLVVGFAVGPDVCVGCSEANLRQIAEENPTTRGHDFGKKCICVADHNPEPLELERHHVWPLGMGGPDTEGNVVWLDPTAHMNVHELLRLMLKWSNTDLLPYKYFTDLYDQAVNRYCYDVAAAGFKANRDKSVWPVKKYEVEEHTHGH